MADQDLTQRPAQPGERCTCGREDGGEQTGPCPFCGGQRHQGRCPAYRLRPDPP
jgi:hypothetical protein